MGVRVVCKGEHERASVVVYVGKNEDAAGGRGAACKSMRGPEGLLKQNSTYPKSVRVVDGEAGQAGVSRARSTHTRLYTSLT